MRELSQQKNEKELEECTFKPNLAATERSLSRQSRGNIFERSQQWQD